MKICVLTSSYPQFNNDNAGIFVFNLVKKIAFQKDITQYIIAPHSKRSKFFENYKVFSIFRFPYFFPLSLQKLCYGSGIVKNIQKNKFLIFLVPFFIIVEFFSLLILSKKKSFELVHAHWIIPQGIIAFFCKKLLKIPYIVSIHGSDIFAFNSLIFTKIYEIVLNNSELCTANSRKTAGFVKKLTRTPVKQIPMGVDLDLFYRNKIDSGKFEKKRQPRVLFVGRLIDWKGVTYLLDAIFEIMKYYPDIILTIVGDGTEKKNLIKKVRGLNIQNNVEFIGVLPNKDLPNIFWKSDVFVIPSIINCNGETEGLGTVALEAMACGTPVVGSNVGGIPDIIKDHITGLLSVEKDSGSIAKCILQILEDDCLKKKICANASKLVEEEYSWDIISNKFFNIYKKILIK